MTEGPLRVAFCGLGRMGQRMAVRVAQAGFPTVVWNRSASAGEAVVSQAAVEVAATPGAASEGADVALLMLTDGPAVLDVLGSAEGVLSTLAPGALVVDCSTSGPEHTRRAAELCRGAGVAFLDCPVSGSTAIAAAGKLGLMVGGSEADLARARPVLESFGSSVVHVGPTGAGATAKVAVNGLLHTFSTALAEALVAAESAGVTRDRLFDVLATGVLANRFLDYKREAFCSADRDVPVAFDLRTATKDLTLAQDVSTGAGMAEGLFERALAMHQEAVGRGYGERDMATIVDWLSDVSEVTPHENSS
jgi:3-hydroxyisobutyrate dehydrogenase-like beta-hydroxyacid dehydrogenase